MLDDLKKFYKNKKIFITGNTGFKGSWLTMILNSFNSRLCGYSLSENSKPNMFNLLNLKHKIKLIKGDVRNFQYLNKSVNNMVIRNGDLNKLTKSMLDPALNADIYVVFGSSYIKGWLIEYLVENNALNIHMGMSPYYRGSSCNFWAIYDSNPHLMGATIHMLSKGLDSGEILYQVMPTTENCKNPFDFTMTSVLSAHKSIVQRIETKEIFDYEPTKQNRSLEIRYSKNSDFTDEIAKTFLDRKLSISEIQYLIDKNLNYTEYINPFKLT